MTYRWLTDLDQALAAAGLPYVEVGPSEADYTASASWRERGRPASTGEFDPTGVLCHHTASPAGTSDQADLNGILWGNSQAPGPVSSLYLGRTGVLYVVAAGRCNHGGQGKRPGLDAGCADMNRHTLGIEAGNSGVGEYWADAQIEVYAATVAALCSWYGWGLDRVWLHATTGPPYGGCNSKIDPAGPWALQPDLVGSTTWDLDLWREVCAQVGAGSAVPLPPAVEATERRRSMSEFVIIYGVPDVADGTVLEIVQGHKRHVPADEWWEVLKGVVMGPDGSVPPHHPWQPVAYVTNGYYALSLPNFDTATGLAVPTLAGPP